MKLLNALQKVQIRKKVALVRTVQESLREAYERGKRATQLRKDMQVKLAQAQRELEEIRSSSVSRIGGHDANLEKAAKYARGIEEEIAVFDKEIAMANTAAESFRQDLACVQPVAEKLIKLIDREDPIRKIFEFTESDVVMSHGRNF